MSCPTNPSIDDLLRACSTGDAQARDRLLAMYRARLRQMVSMRLDDRVAARVDPSDVVQEAILAASQQLPGYLQHRPLPFYPWLRQFAVERLQKLHRHHISVGKRSVTREASQTLPLNQQSSQMLAMQFTAAEASPSQQLMNHDRQQRVRQAVDALGGRDREILALRHVEQLSISEVAAVLGISETAAKSRHFRALRRLQQMLGESHGVDL